MAVHKKILSFFQREKLQKLVENTKEILIDSIQKVVDFFNFHEDLKCRELVNSVKFKKCHKKQMEHVKKGCLSDLPNVNYYLQVSGPESSRKIFEFYKTIRGTSQTENLHLISADIFNFVTHMCNTYLNILIMA